MKKFVILYKRFERFWHWCQAMLIISLIITGLEVHGIIDTFGFGTAVNVHNWAGFAWTTLIVLIFTWIFTTGEWRQWLPTMKGVDKTLRFYLYGVFLGEQHPHHATPEIKFNPLQRLAYIGVLFGLLPLQILTGLAFFFFPELRDMGVIGRVDLVAILHTFIAYALMCFLVVHLYLITFGKRLSTHIMAMLTGKEEIEH